MDAEAQPQPTTATALTPQAIQAPQGAAAIDVVAAEKETLAIGSATKESVVAQTTAAVLASAVAPIAAHEVKESGMAASPGAAAPKTIAPTSNDTNREMAAHTSSALGSAVVELGSVEGENAPRLPVHPASNAMSSAPKAEESTGSAAAAQVVSALVMPASPEAVNEADSDGVNTMASHEAFATSKAPKNATLSALTLVEASPCEGEQTGEPSISGSTMVPRLPGDVSPVTVESRALAGTVLAPQGPSGDDANHTVSNAAVAVAQVLGNVSTGASPAHAKPSVVTEDQAITLACISETDNSWTLSQSASDADAPAKVVLDPPEVVLDPPEAEAILLAKAETVALLAAKAAKAQAIAEAAVAEVRALQTDAISVGRLAEQEDKGGVHGARRSHAEATFPRGATSGRQSELEATAATLINSHSRRLLSKNAVHRRREERVAVCMYEYHARRGSAGDRDTGVANACKSTGSGSQGAEEEPHRKASPTRNRNMPAKPDLAYIAGQWDPQAMAEAAARATAIARAEEEARRIPTKDRSAAEKPYQPRECRRKPRPPSIPLARTISPRALRTKKQCSVESLAHPHSIHNALGDDGSKMEQGEADERFHSKQQRHQASPAALFHELPDPADVMYLPDRTSSLAWTAYASNRARGDAPPRERASARERRQPEYELPPVMPPRFLDAMGVSPRQSKRPPPSSIRQAYEASEELAQRFSRMELELALQQHKNNMMWWQGVSPREESSVPVQSRLFNLEASVLHRGQGKQRNIMAAYGASNIGERRISTSDLDRLAMPKGLGGPPPRFPPVKGAIDGRPDLLRRLAEGPATR